MEPQAKGTTGDALWSGAAQGDGSGLGKAVTVVWHDGGRGFCQVCRVGQWWGKRYLWCLKEGGNNKVEASALSESPLLNVILCLSPRKGSELNCDLFLLLPVLFRSCITILRWYFQTCLLCNLFLTFLKTAIWFDFFQYGFSILANFELGISFWFW